MRNDLLLAACGGSWDSSAPGVQSSNWSYLCAAAERQGVAPVLHHWLQQHPEIPVPTDASIQLQNLYWAQHFRNRVMLQELDTLTDAASRAGIECIRLKGATLAVDYYATPALRPMSDLDLLVHLQDLDRMAHVLRTLAYVAVEATPSYAADAWLDRGSREHIWTKNRDGMEVLVEYRATALQPTVGRVGDLDGTLAFAVRTYTDAMWARAVRGANTPSGRRQPSREDLLLHVAAHLGAQHSDFRLIWLHDLRRIVSQPGTAVDWDYVFAQAAALRIAAAVWAALKAAAHWIAAPIPAGVLDRLHDVAASSSARLQEWERRRLDRHVAALGDADLTVSAPAVWPPLAALGRMRGWGPRLRTLRWAVFPSGEYLRHRGARPGALGHITTAARRWLLAVTRLSTDRR